MIDTFILILHGFAVVLQPLNLLAAVIGAFLGIIVGAIPGIGSLAGVALLLPVTFSFNPTAGIIMLSAIYYANMYGGSFSAILINIPGDSPAVMTALDGYPLTQKGKAGKALFTANLSSFIGGTLGIIILTLVGPSLARVGLKFGPIEMTSLLLLAMTSLGWLIGGSPLKGMISTLLGILLATMGFDIVNGAPRYHFGILYFLSGIPFIPLVIGMFGFSQVMGMLSVLSSKKQESGIQNKLTIRESFLTRDEVKKITKPAIRSGILGTLIGILPGAGATTGSFLGYILEKKIGRNRKELGKGAPEGIAAAEAANNAAAAGAFAPLLSLGIPGSGTGAVLLGGFLMYGITPGPLLFQNEPDLAWGLIASLYIANIITLLVAILFIPFLIKILNVSSRVMIPIITIVCIVGSYSASNSMFGVLIMLSAGFLGYILKRNGYPIAPLLLAFILSGNFERNFRRSLILSDGNFFVFFREPISAAFMSLFLVTVLVPFIRGILQRINRKNKEMI